MPSRSQPTTLFLSKLSSSEANRGGYDPCVFLDHPLDGCCLYPTLRVPFIGLCAGPVLLYDDPEVYLEVSYFRNSMEKKKLAGKRKKLARKNKSSLKRKVS